MYTVAEALLTFASNLYTFVCSHSKHFGGLQLVSGKLHRELGQYGSLIERVSTLPFFCTLEPPTWRQGKIMESDLVIVFYSVLETFQSSKLFQHLWTLSVNL